MKILVIMQMTVQTTQKYSYKSKELEENFRVRYSMKDIVNMATIEDNL